MYHKRAMFFIFRTDHRITAGSNHEVQGYPYISEGSHRSRDTLREYFRFFRTFKKSYLWSEIPLHTPAHPRQPRLSDIHGIY